MPHTLPAGSFRVISSATAAFPISTSKSYSDSFRPVSWQILSPAPVHMATLSFCCAAQTYAATHLVPLPESSASEPSALIKRISKSAEACGYIHSTPSAPIPSCRLHIRRVSPAMSAGARSSLRIPESINRKSLPQALAFTNGITTGNPLTLTPPGRVTSRCPARSRPQVRAAALSGQDCSPTYQTANEHAGRCCRSKHFALCDADAPECDLPPARSAPRWRQLLHRWSTMSSG